MRYLKVLRRKALERDFDDELRFHLEERIARNREDGMSQAEAERAAHRQFGSVEAAKRKMWEMRMMNQHFVAGLMAGLLVAGIPAGLMWMRFQTPSPPAPQVTPYQKGDFVQVQPSDDGTILPAQRVIAVPGDRVRIDGDGVFVNDRRVSVSSELIAKMSNWSETVPTGHYFLMNETVERKSISRFWGLLQADRILTKVSPQN